VEQRIHSGRLARGARLPTVRELAATLKVSPTTVAAAYKLLHVRGFVAGKGRAGTRVATRPPTPAATPVAIGPAIPEGAVDLATGGPDPTLLPPLESAIRGLDTRHRLYGDEPRLRALVTFAADEFESDGIPSGSISVLSGALDAVERVLREQLKPGDAVAVEDPCFPGIPDLLKALGLGVVPVPMDEEGPLPDGLEQALKARCRALLVTPRAQNPTGATITPQRAGDLRVVLRRFSDVVLVENDYAGPIAGTGAVSLREPSRKHWAIVRSTSKFLGPDLRVAVMAADELTTARVQGRQALGMRWVSLVLQQLTVALWSDPANGRRLARSAEIYTQRRRTLVDALVTRGIPAFGRSGLNVWIPVSEEVPVVRGLADRGWAVAAGERFRIRSPRAIRVTISTLAPPEANRFAEDLREVLGTSQSSVA
jgi:DNA-binding transcriptional MocR family regulator